MLITGENIQILRKLTFSWECLIVVCSENLAQKKHVKYLSLSAFTRVKKIETETL